MSKATRKAQRRWKETMNQQKLNTLAAELTTARTKPEGYWHVTRPENIRSILKDGIKANEGKIFVITHPALADTIARDQIFAERYGLIRIAPQAIDRRRLGPDHVAEFAAPWHRIIYQGLIDPRHLTLEGRYRVPRSRPLPFDYVRGWWAGLSVSDSERDIVDPKNWTTR